jgi:hypothetical protein
MPVLREARSVAAVAAAERVQRVARQHQLIDRRLDQRGRDRDALLKAAAACRRGTDHLPEGDERERLLRRITALGCELAPFAAVRALHGDTAWQAA